MGETLGLVRLGLARKLQALINTLYTKALLLVSATLLDDNVDDKADDKATIV